MKRVVEHEMTQEQRKHHRVIREDIDAEKVEIVARDRRALALRDLVAEARSILTAVGEGQLTAEQLARLSDSLERAEAVLSEEERAG
ncbi:hypothetical protein Mal4_11420 [Maioricimonas rarisocia]|uniref:Uncharacterized protein n=1 Tax=Maioricimonas rarisocia TaxID=2528026 RepID=A0A517Z2X0_9PLAN|nr:hypothetical protein [Maioricimonas rarisocia]QDU36842.1 hypothetical protein Mal4_11420 [Maioricimonas rarisocia]